VNAISGTSPLFRRPAIPKVFSLQLYVIGLELGLSAIADFQYSGPSEYRAFGIMDMNRYFLRG